MLLIGFSLGIIGLISLEADISWGNIVLMGSVLLLAVVVPYVVDRFVFSATSSGSRSTPAVTGRPGRDAGTW